MLRQTKLLKAIQEVLKECERSEPLGGQGRFRISWIVQHNAPTKLRDMTKEAGDDQERLRKVVHSLEETISLRSQNWRERANE
jgi:hypothetical protein